MRKLRLEYIRHHRKYYQLSQKWTRGESGLWLITKYLANDDGIITVFDTSANYYNKGTSYTGYGLSKEEALRNLCGILYKHRLRDIGIYTQKESRYN